MKYGIFTEDGQAGTIDGAGGQLTGDNALAQSIADARVHMHGDAAESTLHGYNNGYLWIKRLDQEKHMAIYADPVADRLNTVLGKVGPKGYIHGWICVRPPCGSIGDAVHHSEHGPGVITHVHPETGEMHARFSDGAEGQLGKPRVPVRTLVGLGQKPEESVTSDKKPRTPGKPSRDTLHAPAGSSKPAPGDSTHEQEDALGKLMDAAEKSGIIGPKEAKAMHDELHILQEALAKERDEAAKQDFAWHLGVIVGGFVLAAAVAGFAPAALVALAAATIPLAATELINKKHGHSSARNIRELELHNA